MKKVLLLALCAVTLQLLQAQDLKKVQTAYLIKKMDEAKTEVDKVMADPKQNTKPEALYWKARVYAALYKDPAMVAKYPNAGHDADEAFQKYAAADPSFAEIKSKGADGVFDMYSTAYGNGVKVFNDKKWAEAADNFKMAVEYSDLIFHNKWTNATMPFDTTSILYLAYAYQNASKPAEAAKYYGRLADAKVSGESYLDVYKFLVNHYTITKNEDMFRKYVALGREVYPKYAWDEFEIDFIDQNLNLAQKTALYEKDDAAGGMTEMKYLQFGDIFVNAKNKDKSLDSLQVIAYTKRALDAYKKAYNKNPQNGVAAYNVGVIYYNMYVEYDDVYASNIRAMQALNADKPVEKDPKKKAAADAKFNEKLAPYIKANAEISKPLNENLDLSIEWLEKCYTALKDKPSRSSTEKSVINKTVDFLANMYAYKRDRARGKDLKAMDAADAKYKEFDALHGKF